MVRLAALLSAVTAAVSGALLESSSDEVAFLTRSKIVQQLASDPDMVMKLELLQRVADQNNEGRLSLIEIEQNPTGSGVKKITSMAEASKELAPVFEKMKTLDPKGAQMLQSIMQMVSALGKQAKPAPVAVPAPTEKSVKAPAVTKKAFMQVQKKSHNINHFGGATAGDAVDPAVMEERLMRIQPILLKLKHMNGHLFGGLANVVQKAERRAEDEVVSGSLK